MILLLIFFYNYLFVLFLHWINCTALLWSTKPGVNRFLWGAVKHEGKPHPIGVVQNPPPPARPPPLKKKKPAAPHRVQAYKWPRNWGNIKVCANCKETEKEMCEIFLNRDSVCLFLGKRCIKKIIKVKRQDGESCKLFFFF